MQVYWTWSLVVKMHEWLVCKQNEETACQWNKLYVHQCECIHLYIKTNLVLQGPCWIQSDQQRDPKSEIPRNTKTYT